MALLGGSVQGCIWADSQHGEVVNVQDHWGENAGVVEQGEHGQVSEGLDRNDGSDDAGGTLIDEQVDHQDRAQVEDVDRNIGMADMTVDQQPVVRPKRNRKPNSKYDPAVFDLDTVQIKEILVSGRKNGWRGVYWPQ